VLFITFIKNNIINRDINNPRTFIFIILITLALLIKDIVKGFYIVLKYKYIWIIINNNNYIY
jgi:hypothetical protein